jgi:hypothetical protein
MVGDYTFKWTVSGWPTIRDRSVNAAASIASSFQVAGAWADFTLEDSALSSEVGRALNPQCPSLTEPFAEELRDRARELRIESYGQSRG